VALQKLTDSIVHVTASMLWVINYCCFSFLDTQRMHVGMSMSFCLAVNTFKFENHRMDSYFVLK